MADGKRIVVVLPDLFADWEYGLFAATARLWFKATVSFASPSAGKAVSAAGLEVSGLAGLGSLSPDDHDAIVAIGSDVWFSDDPPDISSQLIAFSQAGRVIGCICGATLAAARAGLLDDHDHTSNGRDFLAAHFGDYSGMHKYRDVPRAVRDGNLVTAPSSAPGTFTCRVLEALLPDAKEQIVQVEQLFASEYQQEPD